MKTLSRLLAISAAVAALAASANAVTRYTETVTAATSVTIPNSTHQINSRYIGLVVRDSAGVIQPTTAYSYSIDGTTYSVTVNWTSAFTGSVELIGSFQYDTTATDDFLCRDYWSANDGARLSVCEYCSDSSYSQRTYSSKKFVALRPSWLRASGSATVRVYFLDNTLVYGFRVTGPTAAGQCSGGNCVVRYNIQDFPTGSTPLCQISLQSGVWTSGSLQDLRPWR